jgi:hypothetical protein
MDGGSEKILIKVIIGIIIILAIIGCYYVVQEI